MKIAIPFLKWSGKASLEFEIPDNTLERFRLRAAIEIAVGKGADLARADLTGADLADADLARAYLARADLARADLTGAYLAGAYLTGADLTGAYLAGAYLADADLAGANLAGAYLAGAYLAGAYLAGANLAGADFTRAENVGDFTMADGLKFSEYLRDVVPALLTAGGKTVEDVVSSGAWDCHSWDNCPMAVAFDIGTSDKAPPLLRARVREFVQFFDAGLIPKPDISAEAKEKTDA